MSQGRASSELRRPRHLDTAEQRRHESIKADSVARPILLITDQWADLPLEEVAGLARRGVRRLRAAYWGEHLDPYIAARLALSKLTAGQGTTGPARPTAVLHNSGVIHNFDEEPKPLVSLLGNARAPNSYRAPGRPSER